MREKGIRVGWCGATEGPLNCLGFVPLSTRLPISATLDRQSSSSCLMRTGPPPLQCDMCIRIYIDYR